MTSEVLILNKRAVVIAADSAITTSGGAHPRYSKSATKVFDLSFNGAIAATVFGNATVDGIPWELAIKLFRQQLGDTTFDRIAEYTAALTNFLSGNALLYPLTLREKWIESQFDNAVLEIIKFARGIDPLLIDASVPLADRQARWVIVAADISQKLDESGIAPSLSAAALADISRDLETWVARVQQQLLQVPELDAIDSHLLAELGHKFRYTRPDLLLSTAGLVIAGYGDADIFPGWWQITIYGHVGHELCFTETSSYQIAHDRPAMIQPLAQTSMIDTFTDGFGKSLESIIETESRKGMDKIIAELVTNGVAVPQPLGRKIADKAHSEFMTEWKRENWKQNYHPLLQVIGGLEIEEMAHLAETLLGLESLKERVTSPTESVGGPIDVAAITKAEGLVWIKRKHYFDADLNMRYATRVRRSMEIRDNSE